MRLAEELPVKNAVVQSRIVLTWYIHHLFRLQPRRQRLKELHPLRVFAGRLSLVRQIAREEDEIGLLLQPVDDVNRLLERLCAGRIRRPAEADVRIAELYERERSELLAVLTPEPLPHRRRRSAAGHRGRDRDQCSDAERDPGDFEKFASVEPLVHLNLPMCSMEELGGRGIHPCVTESSWEGGAGGGNEEC